MFIPKVLLREILEYGIQNTYVLHDWIDEKSINMQYLCKNPLAAQYIEKKLHEDIELKSREMESLCSNKCQEAIDLFEKYFLNEPDVYNCEDISFDCICELSGNPFAIELLKKNNSIKYILKNTNKIFENSNAMDIIIKNINKINTDKLEQLCLNTNPKAIAIIKKSYIEKLTQKCLSNLCYNVCSEAIDLVEELMQKHVLDDDCINNLCRNKNPKAINLIEHKLFDTLEETELEVLCSNPSAINLIEHKILPQILSKDTSIYEEHKEALICGLCENPTAVHLLNGVLSEYITDACIDGLILNPNPEALDIIKRKFLNDLSFGDYAILSTNPSIFMDIRKKILTDIIRMFD